MGTELNKTIGENLRKYRIARALSQENVAEYLKMSQSGYAKYERGETKFGLEFVISVADYLGVTVNDLTKGESEQLMMVNEDQAPYIPFKKNRCSLVIELDGTFRAEETAINMVRQISQTLKAMV